MALSDLTEEAVLRAIAECDQIGREAFLALYGFGPARAYFLVHDGKRYDSKAIAGVAHRFARPDEGPLTADTFSGGEATVAAKLRELGFVVGGERPNNDTGHEEPISEGRNPPWTRDELILALELYLSNPRSPPGKTSKEVAELSSTLNLLGHRFGIIVEGRYRNVNGVYMKMMNFRRFDPTAIASGRVGLTRGNRDEEAVWKEFAHDQTRLKTVAKAIVAALGNDDEWALGSQPLHDDFSEAAEGRVLTHVHITRERNRKLVERKKASAQSRSGRLQCEVCDFDFEARYGERGRGFIEAHHIKPVHTLEEGDKTKLTDLALVCANCHRMIHASRPWLQLHELRVLVMPSRH